MWEGSVSDLACPLDCNLTLFALSPSWLPVFTHVMRCSGSFALYSVLAHDPLPKQQNRGEPCRSLEEAFFNSLNG